MITKNLIFLFIDIAAFFVNKIGIPLISYISFPAGFMDSLGNVTLVACYLLPIAPCMPLILASFTIMGFLCARALIHVIYNLVKLLPLI